MEELNLQIPEEIKKEIDEKRLSLLNFFKYKLFDYIEFLDEESRKIIEKIDMGTLSDFDVELCDVEYSILYSEYTNKDIFMELVEEIIEEQKESNRRKIN